MCANGKGDGKGRKRSLNLFDESIQPPCHFFPQRQTSKARPDYLLFYSLPFDHPNSRSSLANTFFICKYKILGKIFKFCLKSLSENFFGKKMTGGCSIDVRITTCFVKKELSKLFINHIVVLFFGKKSMLS